MRGQLNVTNTDEYWRILTNMRVFWTTGLNIAGSSSIQKYTNNTGQQVTSWANTLIFPPSCDRAFSGRSSRPVLWYVNWLTKHSQPRKFLTKLRATKVWLFAPWRRPKRLSIQWMLLQWENKIIFWFYILISCIGHFPKLYFLGFIYVQLQL